MTALTDTASPRRNPRAEGAIFDATIQLLAEVGFAGLTIEGIAARAGVGKTTIYRHWCSKARLVDEAVRARVAPIHAPDTGRLEEDLRLAIESVIAVVSTPPISSLLPSLVDAAERDPEMARLHAEFTAERRQLMKALLRRGAARGEIPVPADIDLLCDMVAGPVLYRRLVSHRSFGRSFARDLAAAVMRAAG